MQYLRDTEEIFHVATLAHDLTTYSRAIRRKQKGQSTGQLIKKRKIVKSLSIRIALEEAGGNV